MEKPNKSLQLATCLATSHAANRKGHQWSASTGASGSAIAIAMYWRQRKNIFTFTAFFWLSPGPGPGWHRLMAAFRFSSIGIKCWTIPKWRHNHSRRRRHSHCSFQMSGTLVNVRSTRTTSIIELDRNRKKLTTDN